MFCYIRLLLLLQTDHRIAGCSRCRISTIIQICLETGLLYLVKYSIKLRNLVHEGAIYLMITPQDIAGLFESVAGDFEEYATGGILLGLPLTHGQQTQQ